MGFEILLCMAILVFVLAILVWMMIVTLRQCEKSIKKGVKEDESDIQ